MVALLRNIAIVDNQKLHVKLVLSSVATNVTNNCLLNVDMIEINKIQTDVWSFY